MSRREGRMMLMGRRWRGRGGIVEDSLVIEAGMLVKLPLVPLLSSPAAPASSFFSSRRSYHIVEIHKDPTS